MDAHVIYTVTRQPVPDLSAFHLPILGTDQVGRTCVDPYSSIVHAMMSALHARQNAVRGSNWLTVVWTDTGDLVTAACVWCDRTFPVMWLRPAGAHGLVCPVSTGEFVCRARPKSAAVMTKRMR
jgi:hypothetical protein